MVAIKQSYRCGNTIGSFRVNTVRKLREHRTVRSENIGSFKQGGNVFQAKASD